VKIAQDLKNVIEEKTDLDNQLNEVERNLIAAKSNKSNERRESVDGKQGNTYESTSPSLNTEGTGTDPQIKFKAADDNIKSLYKNVLTRGKTSSKDVNQEVKSSSMRIDNFCSIEDTEVQDTSPATPKIKEDKQLYQPRHDRKTSDIQKFNMRSSSIHSMRSNKNINKSKKLKPKKPKQSVKKTFKSRVTPMAEIDRRNISERSDSVDSFISEDHSPRSSVSKFSTDQKEPDELPELKIQKGLSSFAKVTSNKKKKVKRKIRKFKTNKDGLAKGMLVRGQAVAIEEKEKPVHMHHTSNKDIKPLHLAKEESKDDVIDEEQKSNSSFKRLSKIVKLMMHTSRIITEERNMSDNLSDKNSDGIKETGNVMNNGSLTSRDLKRIEYQKKGRHNSIMQQANSFMNVFNSFVGDESTKKRISRRSSILVNVKSSSSKELLGKTSHFSFKRVRRASRKNLLKLYQKNRSKSECEPNIEKKSLKLRRTLSDFHECILLKQFLAIEMYTGINLQKKIELSKNPLLMNEYLEDMSSSVSDTNESKGTFFQFRDPC